jgi:hypothetical protein
MEKLYRDSRSLTIPCDTPPGDYPLLVGWYDYDDPTASLLVTLPDETPIGGVAYLTTVKVR